MTVRAISMHFLCLLCLDLAPEALILLVWFLWLGFGSDSHLGEVMVYAPPPSKKDWYSRTGVTPIWLKLSIVFKSSR